MDGYSALKWILFALLLGCMIAGGIIHQRLKAKVTASHPLDLLVMMQEPEFTVFLGVLLCAGLLVFGLCIVTQSN